MFELVLNNKEWLFSGLGISAIGTAVYVGRIIYFSKSLRTYEKSHVIEIRKRTRLTFNEVGSQIRQTVLNPLRKEGWVPEIIFCSGRGGVIIGGIVAASLKQQEKRIPIRMVDTEFSNGEKRPELDLIRSSDVHGKRRILIVESTRQSRKIYAAILSKILELKPDGDEIDLRDYVLVWAPIHDDQEGIPPRYYSYRTHSCHPMHVTFPWYLK